MTATITTTEIVQEIRECLEAEGVGRVLDHDETTVRIRFDELSRAAGWCDDYASLTEASFEKAPLNLAGPVVILLAIAAYDFQGD